MTIDPSEVTITDEQAALLDDWLAANERAPGMLGGYALGSSYIDTRAKSGAKSDGRQAYVDLDWETARAVPELRGEYSRHIREFLDARLETSSTFTMP